MRALVFRGECNKASAKAFAIIFGLLNIESSKKSEQSALLVTRAFCTVSGALLPNLKVLLTSPPSVLRYARWLAYIYPTTASSLSSLLDFGDMLTGMIVAGIGFGSRAHRAASRIIMPDSGLAGESESFVELKRRKVMKVP